MAKTTGVNLSSRPARQESRARVLGLQREGDAGAVFALFAQRGQAAGVGAVTGVVAAASGLGSFVPPLVMGPISGGYSSYALELALLSLVALTAVAYTFAAISRPVARHA